MSELHTRPAPSTSLELEYNKRLMVVSGPREPASSPHRIASKLGVELGAVTLKTFSNGEVYCRYDESMRGARRLHRPADLRQPAHGHHAPTTR